VIGMERDDNVSVQCECCVGAKICRKIHPRVINKRTKAILELWHMDLIGPIKPESQRGNKYIFTIVDDYSRVLFIRLLKAKNEAAEELKKLIVLKENQSGRRLKAIRSDNGGEFVERI